LPISATAKIFFAEIANISSQRPYPGEAVVPIIGSPVAKRVKVTCDDCFFRRADLCALAGNEPCPTFRPAKVLTPPQQARLVARPLRPQHAAA
jgi:hypothetical protein